jgi:hypothetical protein
MIMAAARRIASLHPIARPPGTASGRPEAADQSLIRTALRRVFERPSL